MLSADDIRTKITLRLEKLRQEIVANIERDGITASCRTQRSLKVVIDDKSISLVASPGQRAPLSTLEIGRPPGNVPGGFRTTKAGVQDVSNTFKAILVRWAKDKGIADFGWGAATMLGRRIAAEGTLRHTKNVDVYSTAVERAKKDIQQIVSQDIFTLVSSEIKAIKQNF